MKKLLLFVMLSVGLFANISADNNSYESEMFSESTETLIRASIDGNNIDFENLGSGLICITENEGDVTVKISGKLSVLDQELQVSCEATSSSAEEAVSDVIACLCELLSQFGSRFIIDINIDC